MTEGKKSQKIDTELVRQKIEKLIINFETELQKKELRPKVLALIPIFQNLRVLGKALIPSGYSSSARDRILHYFREYPETIIGGNELLVISGIQEYARRVRELRVQFGWAIASGVTIKDMEEDQSLEVPSALKSMKPSDYILLSKVQDRDAAHRWNMANSIRREPVSVRDKILKYLKSNIGKLITNEELRYVSGDKTEWARRVRELRTEFGWPIVTKSTGRPDLALGVYILEANRQSPEHDRYIPDNIRRDILRRDEYKCQICGWSYKEWNPSDPRHLELHHKKPHVEGGMNTKDNLLTLCIVCHDQIHRK